MPNRIRYFAAVLLIALVAGALRLYAVQRLNVDYDEPVYLAAAVEYANAMRSGDLKMLAWSEHTYEHPALQKILYGVVLLTQSPLQRLPDNDLPRLAPVASTEAGRWNVAVRHLAALWGTLAALVLGLVNPLAGFFLAVDTLSVKYTSEVYLEALPLLTGLLCAIAYLRWFSALQRARASSAPPLTWLVLSALFLGMTAAGKYAHALVGFAVIVHFVIAVIRRQLPPRSSAYMAGWAGLALLMFIAFDPYLWPHPITRLSKSLLFHEDFQSSLLVHIYNYPFWQPFRWLSAFSAYYDLGPASAFVLDLDTFVFVAAIIGLPRLYRQQPFFFYWLLLGLIFLLAWTTKWPQYTLIVLAPFSMAAAQGIWTVRDLARAAIAAARSRRSPIT